MPRQTSHDRRRNRPVRPAFTHAQADMLRVAISYGQESEDPLFRRILGSAKEELDRAQLTASHDSKGRLR
jgi:hypothetical protein